MNEEQGVLVLALLVLVKHTGDWRRRMAGDEETAKKRKRDRRLYLAGPNKGQARPSAATRKRRRAGAAYGRRRGQTSAIEQLVEQLELEEREDATSEVLPNVGQVTKFRLGRGYREEAGGATQYSLDSDEEKEWRGRLVVLSSMDMENGQRWAREGYPEWMTDKYSKKELEKKVSRMGGDHGKQFVEYQGRWYEASETK